MMIAEKLMASSDMAWTERSKCDGGWELPRGIDRDDMEGKR